ncbi:MAG: hypothetical protein D6767_04510 [Candidatus Hydrogenedentota bacterium]|nr:MAG: hypothetical protein D6767_04510 [Candidatus Hydrogenedentota bacterium]
MGRLKKIVKAIESESSGVQGRLLLARVGLKAGVNLSKITENTPDNPEIEKRILAAARVVLRKEIKIEGEENE